MPYTKNEATLAAIEVLEFLEHLPQIKKIDGKWTYFGYWSKEFVQALHDICYRERKRLEEHEDRQV
jgi:hypothetical protein